MKTTILFTLILATGSMTVFSSYGFAHCQVPCGIYDDSARIASMTEDVKTVEKAISEIKKLTDIKDPQVFNQRVRWVQNKEEHAQKIIDTISDYFLTQRVVIKEGDKTYLDKLADHHKVIVLAMKVKQSVDEKPIESLKKSIDNLNKYYHSH